MIWGYPYFQKHPYVCSQVTFLIYWAYRVRHVINRSSNLPHGFRNIFQGFSWVGTQEFSKRGWVFGQFGNFWKVSPFTILRGFLKSKLPAPFGCKKSLSLVMKRNHSLPGMIVLSSHRVVWWIELSWFPVSLTIPGTRRGRWKLQQPSLNGETAKVSAHYGW